MNWTRLENIARVIYGNPTIVESAIKSKKIQGHAYQNILKQEAMENFVFPDNDYIFEYSARKMCNFQTDMADKVLHKLTWNQHQVHRQVSSFQPRPLLSSCIWKDVMKWYRH